MHLNITFHELIELYLQNAIKRHKHCIEMTINLFLIDITRNYLIRCNLLYWPSL